MTLLACPFCRELYRPEEASECPECEVRLLPLSRLPPSLDGLAEAEAAGVAARKPDAEGERLPWTHFGAGRGPLILLALLGLAAFFGPWVVMSQPEAVELSGADLARRLGWLWGGAVGWFVLIALLVSRRSTRGLRGIRVIAAVFSVMTLLEVLVLVSFSPTSTRYLPLEYDWGWALYVSGALSVMATAVAVRLGGTASVAPARARSEAAGLPEGGGPTLQ
jgi:hypothetical protein